MKKILAKEVNPRYVDFSYYFDDDGLKSAGGENCAVYIIVNEGYGRISGFNIEEYKEIREKAEAVIEGFHDVSNKWTNSYGSYREVMEYNGIPYTSRKCHLLKEWAKTADTSDTDSIADFLTITTGEEWAVKTFTGYSQGDYCEVVYCVNHYTPERITEIGELWLGCGTEFCIDGCYGYFVPESIRWREGETLRKYLADSYGCEPEELEIYLYEREHIVTDYRKMD